MNKTTDDKPFGKGFAKVPHGIADTAICDTLKLLLWLCYDRPADWTYSVSEVAHTMGKTPQCIRKYFRLMINTGVFTSAGQKEVKHGVIPIYLFHPEKVATVVKSELKTNPETNPETDRETDPEIPVSDTKNNIPRMITENNCNKESHPPLKRAGAPRFLTDMELQELATQSGWSTDQIKKLEQDFLIREVYSNKPSKPRTGFDSLI